MSSLNPKRDTNLETIAENDDETTVLAEQSKLSENETANNSKQCTEQNTTQILEARKSTKTDKRKKKQSKIQTKVNEASEHQPRANKESKFQQKEKKGFIVKGQTNKVVEVTKIKEHDKAADEENDKFTFRKKEGTAQVGGQLYETKLLSFIQLGAIFDQDITKFYLASNIDGIGALDDICFRFKSNKNNKDDLVFMQTKHRNNISEKTNVTMNDVRDSYSDFGIKKYFQSYLEIRAKIISKKVQNCLFEGDNMYNLDFHYIIYTSAGHSFKKDTIKLIEPCSKVNNLILTREEGVVLQLKYKHVSFILHDLIDERFEELAMKFLDMILNVNNDMVDDELIETYRAVLLNYVIKLSDDVSDGPLKAKFRPEFFENNEKYTSMFREKLYNEVIKYKLLQCEEDKGNLPPTHEGFKAENIVKAIGNIIDYDKQSNQFVLISDSILFSGIFDETKGEKIPASAKNVIEIAGKEILTKLEFKVPIEFVNKDAKIRNLRRLKFLTSSLIKLFESAEDRNGVNMIEINENMLGLNELKTSVFDHNGGLSSAVGNLLIIDQETNTFKFNNYNLLENAKNLWYNLNLKENLLKIKNDLMSYRFKICIERFPKVSIEDVAIDEYLVKDFLSKLWFYTGQAKEDSVEVLTKKMIENYLKVNFIPKSIFKVSTDAVFLIVHDNIQKWWMQEQKKHLTKSTSIIDGAVSQLVNNPILTILNIFCVHKIKTIEIEFNKDAINFLNLNEFTSGCLTIITDSNILTGAKLIQYFKDSQDHVFIDFNYVVRFFLFSFDKILHELESKQINTIIIICEIMENSECIQALTHFLHKLDKRKIIIVSNRQTYEELHKDDVVCLDVKYDKNNLNDLSLISQEKVLEKSVVLFQDTKVNLKTIIDNDSKHLITSAMLNKLVDKQVFRIGKTLTSSNYEEIKKLYVNRNIVRSDTSYEVRTLKNLEEDIVVITAPAGMGKSILLSHLCEQTKKEYPNMWIARINLLEYSKQFYEWKKNQVLIDITETLTFLCKAVTYENRNIEIEFAYLDNESNEFELKTDYNGVRDSLELDFFIHCCKTGSVIFLFDGFDEICPHYESVGIQLIKNTIDLNLNGATICSASVIKKPKVWITGRSYNNVKNVIEREFGESYKLEPLSIIQQRIYITGFWNEHMNLDKFTYEQLVNVNSFIEYMSNLTIQDFCPMSLPLHVVYLIAVIYFQAEMNQLPPKLEKRLSTDTLDKDDGIFCLSRLEASELVGTPLHMHIFADYFQNQIKHNLTKDETNKWSLNFNTISFYGRYLNYKLTKRFVDKGILDVYKPDGEMMLEKERNLVWEEHKILAFYAVFCLDYKSHFNELITEDELTAIKSKLASIKYAKEKTGVIDSVIDDVPMFIHRTFADYFATEHLCDILKTAYSQKHIDRLKVILDLIMQLLKHACGFSDSNVFTILKHKLLENEEALLKVFSQSSLVCYPHGNYADSLIIILQFLG